MTHAALDFTEHEDVVFRRAPLSTVLCQIRFPTIYALLDRAGVVGLQESLRRYYPHTEEDHSVELKLDDKRADVTQRAPVWRMADDAGVWKVSAAIDFVALETPRYTDFREFRERLEFILAAVERSLRPGRSKRIGLRKVNVFEHPDVIQYADWAQYLKAELLGLASDESLPGELTTAYSEAQINDEEAGALTIRYGPQPEDTSKFRLDLDYWTNQSFPVGANGDLLDRIESYSHSITSFFHWSLEPELYRYLEPAPRSEVLT